MSPRINLPFIEVQLARSYSLLKMIHILPKCTLRQARRTSAEDNGTRSPTVRLGYGDAQCNSLPRGYWPFFYYRCDVLRKTREQRSFQASLGLSDQRRLRLLYGVIIGQVVDLLFSHAD